MNKKALGIMVFAIVAVISITSLAFAGWGNGCGYGMGRGNNDGGWNHQGGYGHSQQGYNGNLSTEEIAKLDQQRADFFKATDSTRQKLYEKELALQSELAKENPDTGKASKLQGEISRLQSDFDQKRLDYEIQARKSVPNYSQGSGRRGSMMSGGYCRW